MTIQNTEYAWHRALIGYEFALYKRLIGSIDQHIQADWDEFFADLKEKSDQIEDEDAREEFSLLHVTEHQDFEYLRQLSMRSLFVASVSLFEYQFLRVCLIAQRRLGNPIGLSDLGDFRMSRAKRYLTRLGFDVPDQGVEWNDAIRLYRIRNAIAHNGGFVKLAGDTVDFAIHHGVVNQPAANLPSGRQSASGEVRLELTREFCEETLDTLERLLFQLVQAVVNKSRPNTNQ